VQAAETGDLVNVMRCLALGVPAAWVHSDRDGQTALHVACAAGQLAVAEFLILNGDIRGFAVLLVLCDDESPSACVWLSLIWFGPSGAPILGTDDRGKSCVDVADAAGQAEISLWLSKRLKDGCS
jgi:ankyrin repeat protein